MSKLMMYFRINKEITERNKIYEQSISILQGEIKTLREWNNTLQQEKEKLQNVIFVKFGLIHNEANMSVQEQLEQIKIAGNWKDVRANLERMHRKPVEHMDPVLAEQQKHWKEKSEKEVNKGETQ
jgi:tRNA/tmRNA/rRNA uracil-C5-methylase (TrmA/RlmC/RlmD family)